MRSGRPGAGEYSVALQPDVEDLEGDDALAVLRQAGEAVRRTFAGLRDEDVEGLRYAPGKWTPKDILQHLVDDERSYAWRALSIARGDERPHPAFDENLFARHADADRRTLDDLLSEHASVRSSTLAMFASLPEAAWMRRGVSSGEPVTVRGLGFQIAAHEHHHLQVLTERYLTLLDERDG